MRREKQEFQPRQVPNALTVEQIDRARQEMVAHLRNSELRKDGRTFEEEESE